ncbi:Myosin light chain kinase A [Diplonema papillatum]|nr:Myosin light chain kinase A [Diplonema papillatum]
MGMFDIADMAEATEFDNDGCNQKRENRTVFEMYDLLEELGKGSYGVVSKARHKETGSLMAVKSIDKRAAGAKGLREVFSEVEILSLLHHPSIVRLEEIYEDQSTLWLVMDLVEGGELEAELKRQVHFKEHATRRIVKHLLLALEYLHGKGIVHRDLKLANMLVSGRFDEGGYCDVKLADFGFSCVVSNESTLTSFCGTTVFMAPEILTDRPYGKPVDMWAVGVITYLLTYGKLPFSAYSDADLIKQICDAQFAFRDELLETPASSGLKDFIKQLVIVDVHTRLTATEALHHYWVRGETGDSPYDDVCSSDEEDCKVTGVRRFGKRSPRSRWMRHTHAIRAAHRLVFGQRLASLTAEELEIPHLRNFGYLTGSPFEAKNGVIDLTGLFVNASPRVIQRVLDLTEASRNVEVFNVSSNQLSYDTVQAVVKLVAAYPRPLAVDLSNNQISSAGARALLRLARSGKLRSINLRGAGIAADILSQIETALKEARASAPKKSHHLGGPLSPAPRAGSNKADSNSRHGSDLPSGIVGGLSGSKIGILSTPMPRTGRTVSNRSDTNSHASRRGHAHSTANTNQWLPSNLPTSAGITPALPALTPAPNRRTSAKTKSSARALKR